MTRPSNTELRKAIAKALDRPIPDNDEQEAALIDDLIAIFQAREQQLLTGLLGEAVTIRDETTVMADEVEAVPVSVIEAKLKPYGVGLIEAHKPIQDYLDNRNKTNGGGRNGDSK